MTWGTPYRRIRSTFGLPVFRLVPTGVQISSTTTVCRRDAPVRTTGGSAYATLSFYNPTFEMQRHSCRSDRFVWFNGTPWVVAAPVFCRSRRSFEAQTMTTLIQFSHGFCGRSSPTLCLSALGAIEHMPSIFQVVALVNSRLLSGSPSHRTRCRSSLPELLSFVEAQNDDVC